MSKLTPDISFDFRGHSVLVTGATGGIGSAVAEGCAAAGANVILHDRDVTKSKPILEKCRAHGVRVSVVPADFFGDKVLATEPDLDMAIFSAGGCIHYGPVEDMTFEQYDQLMKLNVSSKHPLPAKNNTPSASLNRK